MNSSAIERIRQTHEHSDSLSLLISEVILLPAHSGKETLEVQHRISALADELVADSETLSNFYTTQQKNGQQEEEGESLPSDDAGRLQYFYRKLESLKKDLPPASTATSDPADFEPVRQRFLADLNPDLNLKPFFSGEENFGKFLDLHSNHELFLNLPFTSLSLSLPGSTSSSSNKKRLPYLLYLTQFDKFDSDSLASDLPLRRSPTYAAYLASLLTYLRDFHTRAKPLESTDALESGALMQFEFGWDAGKIQGWPVQTAAEQGGREAGQAVFCHACQKMYSKQTVFDAHLQGKKHVKAVAKLSEDAPASTSSQPAAASASASASAPALAALDAKSLRRAKDKTIAKLECLVRLYGTALASVRQATVVEIERRSALTARERQQELEDAEGENGQPEISAEIAADEPEETRIYNPLRLPMGWDDKPIPVWLYKLHGLGNEYKCEICSGFAYMGRKNFERHFQESRHASGMRALGLPNTKHFMDITSIADALALADKLKSEGRQHVMQVETMEEVEDEDGNVYDKKTFNALRAQGVL